MNPFVIPLNDWAAGERKFHSHAGLEFFQTFDNTEILDADVNVEVVIQKEGMRKVDARVHLVGNVTVACDRCLDPLTLPVEAHPSFAVRFDVPQEEESFSEDGKEILPLSSSQADLDLSQVIYDYVCLALPPRRVHPEGECNPDTVRFLGHQERKDEEAAPSSPFAALKGLFNSK